MAVNINIQPDNFLLIGLSKGFCLTIDCLEKLKSYNTDHKLLNADYNLLTSFSNVHDNNSLCSSINLLIKNYKLYRRPVFTGEKLAPILVQYLKKIREVSEANSKSIDSICKKFVELRKKFTEDLKRKNLLPEVSLSKLLHFIQPSSFWLLDSRVKWILDIWGYPTSFSGYGKFLSDLFCDKEFESFKVFLKQKNSKLIGNHPLKKIPCSFLKLLDKVLWYKK